MGLLRLVSGLFRVVGFLMRMAIVAVMTVVGWILVGDMVSSGRLPPDPLGLAAMGGIPATLFGIPTAYAAGILLFGALLLFGEGSGSSSTGGGFAGGDDSGDGGGFGGDGGGGGGDGE